MTRIRNSLPGFFNFIDVGKILIARRMVTTVSMSFMFRSSESPVKLNDFIATSVNGLQGDDNLNHCILTSIILAIVPSVSFFISPSLPSKLIN